MMDVKIEQKKQNKYINDVSKAFAKKVKKDVHLVEGDDICQYIDICVQNSISEVNIKDTLGKYCKVDSIDCKVSCVLCMTKYQQGEYKRRLPCGHVYHRKCIDRWLFNYNNTTCPSCRHQIG